MNKLVHDELVDIIDDYKSLAIFSNEYNNITPIEFDYYTVNKLSLFLVHEDYDFKYANSIIEKLNFVLPSIKRIFAKPIIHLKEDDEVLPVEAVKLINNNTINHISTHSELWDDFNEDGIKPIKLLTRTYKDNYSIYENVLFAKTIDYILIYLRRNMRLLENLMYTSKNLEFNLLQRVNHLNYFLAIGKLHTGYIRNFSKYYKEAIDCYNQMKIIYDCIHSRLKRNVYRLNHNFSGKFQLHNSNILHNQRDYHRIYNTYKYFNKITLAIEEPTKEQIGLFKTNYLIYLKVLIIFSIMHFNFEPDEGSIIDYNNLNVSFTFKKYHLTVLSENNDVILEFNDNYKIILRPSFYYKESDNNVVYVTPFESENKFLYISISDIESFRRLSQLLLKGMIYSADNFDICPFCGGKMKAVSDEENKYVCDDCRTSINQSICKVTNEKFYYTYIESFKVSDDDVKDTSLKLHYRNITSITKYGEIICPCCNKVHKM